MNRINKVNTWTGETSDLVFKRPGGRIKIGYSSDFFKLKNYGASCNTCWYQGINSSGDTAFDNAVLYSFKSPGGSIDFNDNTMNLAFISDTFSAYSSTESFILEFWIQKNKNNDTQYMSILEIENFLEIEYNPIDCGGGSFGDDYTIISYDENGNLLIGNFCLATNFPISIGTPSGEGIFDHICYLMYKNQSNSFDHYVLFNGIQVANITNQGSILFARNNMIMNKNSINSYGYSITNFRILVGHKFYNPAGFTPPICPISAIGYSRTSIQTPLLLNVFRDFEGELPINNSPITGFTIYTSSGSTKPEYSSLTPFQTIPEIYKIDRAYLEEDYLDLINVYLGNNGGTIQSTFVDAVSTVINDGSCWIQNFNYEDIVISGMTLCIDTGYFFSFPKTGDKIYDLTSNGNNFDIIGSTSQIYEFSANTAIQIWEGNGFFDKIISTNTVPMTGKFSAVIVINDPDDIEVISGVESNIIKADGGNGFRIKITGKELSFYVIVDGENEFLVGEYSITSTLKTNVMFTLICENDRAEVYRNVTRIIYNSSGLILRGGAPISDYITIGENTKLNFSYFSLYNRVLTEEEIEDIFISYSLRMKL